MYTYNTKTLLVIVFIVGMSLNYTYMVDQLSISTNHNRKKRKMKNGEMTENDVALTQPNLTEPNLTYNTVLVCLDDRNNV